ncbi:MAG: hypothetical protein UHS50_08935 [Bacteroidaceae bacterium]|nr:hypothetical protein [Bacteroidaceae bacterium]
MAWKLIEGNWRWPYRVSDQGEVQKQLQSGEWFTLKPYLTNNQWWMLLWQDEKTRKRVLVSKLVADAFMGGTPPGMLRIHKNGLPSDNAVENIIFVTPAKAATMRRHGNSRPVLKVDRAGNVVAIYRSGSEAARANHISQQAICKRCNGLVEDPYRLDGYNYIYEDARKRKNK